MTRKSCIGFTRLDRRETTRLARLCRTNAPTETVIGPVGAESREGRGAHVEESAAADGGALSLPVAF